MVVCEQYEHVWIITLHLTQIPKNIYLYSARKVPQYTFSVEQTIVSILFLGFLILLLFNNVTTWFGMRHTFFYHLDKLKECTLFETLKLHSRFLRNSGSNSVQTKSKQYCKTTVWKQIEINRKCILFITLP